MRNGTVRILAVTHQFPTAYQPTFAPYNRQQFSELARTHEIRIIRPIPWTIAAAQRLRGQWPGAGPMPNPVGSSAITVFYPLFYFTPRVGSHLYGQFFEWSVRDLVERQIAEFRPDVLLTSWAHPDGWAAAQFAKRSGLPVVLKVLGSDVLVQATGKRAQGVREVMESADAVIAVSEDLARHSVQMGARPDRVHVVPEGLAPDQFAPGDQASARARLGLPADGRLIVFAGSVIESKGALDLVEACATLRDRGVSFHCRLVGHGQDGARVEQLIRERQLSDRVACVGLRPHAELAQWFHAADVVTLPSYTEGIPNVLREAIACGRPFVSTTVGGIPEIADPSLSLLVPPANVSELADALGMMVASPPPVDPAVVSRINISWEESARRLESHILSAVAAKNGTRR